MSHLYHYFLASLDDTDRTIVSAEIERVQNVNKRHTLAYLRVENQDGTQTEFTSAGLPDAIRDFMLQGFSRVKKGSALSFSAGTCTPQNLRGIRSRQVLGVFDETVFWDYWDENTQTSQLNSSRSIDQSGFAF